ncbi:MAG: hypothetical protein ABSE51_15125 [Terracidiphilus sp.]|jgi:hypothetical protein
MRPQTIGRVLGIGLRVAGRVAGQRLAASAPNAGMQAANPQTTARVDARGRTKGQPSGRAAEGVTRGVGGFLRPFRRVGGILWLEVTGAFFFLFVVFFGQALWRMRESWAHSENRPKFLVFAAIMAVFLYLSVSSFWRARKR